MTDKEIYKELWNGYEQGKQIDNLISYFNIYLEEINARGCDRLEFRLNTKEIRIILEGLNKL